MQQLRENPWYERIYKIGVVVKGFDGVIELAAGLWLWLAPGSLHALLNTWQGKALSWHGAIGHHLATSLEKTNHELYGGVMLMAIIFLLSHGIIKLALVYALMKELLWAYPYALVVLVLFLAAQIIALFQHQSVGMLLLMLLDIVIIWLVWGEWQKLSSKQAH